MVKHELLIDLLRQVNRNLNKYVKNILLTHDLHPTVIIIMRQVGYEPGITVSELARRTGMAKSHISNLIKDLEEQKWVEKRNDAADQRVLRLFLSPEGEERLRQLRYEIRQHLTALVAHMSEQQAADFITNLAYFNNALESSLNESCQPF